MAHKIEACGQNSSSNCVDSSSGYLGATPCRRERGCYRASQDWAELARFSAAKTQSNAASAGRTHPADTGLRAEYIARAAEPEAATPCENLATQNWRRMDCLQSSGP